MTKTFNHKIIFEADNISGIHYKCEIDVATQKIIFSAAHIEGEGGYDERSILTDEMTVEGITQLIELLTAVKSAI